MFGSISPACLRCLQSPVSTFSLMTSNLAGVNYELFAWEERLHAAAGGAGHGYGAQAT